MKINEMKKAIIDAVVDANKADVEKMYKAIFADTSAVVAEEKPAYKAKSEPKKAKTKGKDKPPVVAEFDKDVYVLWAKYLDVFMEEYGKVRKKDRQTVYDHMYGRA